MSGAFQLSKRRAIPLGRMVANLANDDSLLSYLVGRKPSARQPTGAERHAAKAELSGAADQSPMNEETYLVLAQYRQGSNYEDEIGQRYHFPKKYFNQLTLPDIEFVYFEPTSQGEGIYFGCGQIGEVTADPNNPDLFFAAILNYRPFPHSVPRIGDDGQPRELGPFYNPQNAVRKTTADIFAAICKAGGVELTELGVESENVESSDGIVDPFDPSKIKVDREPMSVFQVLRKIRLGEILLNPDFQRNLVWDPKRKSRLIESALLRIPLPAFYFDGVDANRWAVIDGLQRLSAFKDFMSPESFALVGLEYLKTAEGKRFDQLSRGMQRDLEETQVNSFIIRPETPPEVKFTIFYRINTGGLVLTPQEIRHALFQGEATRLLKTLAGTAEFIRATDGSVDDTRMDARECVLRYLAFRIFPYSGYTKGDLNAFLSGAMRALNEMSSSDLSTLRAAFADAMSRAHSVFGRYAFRKFTTGQNRRGPVNKALFESWANVLQAYPADRLQKHATEIQRKVSSMFLNDGDYVKSLSAGTGSSASVRIRFERAHHALREVLA